MESKRNFKGLKRYESLLQIVCGAVDSSAIDEKEWAKFFGVKCDILTHKKNNYLELTENEWEGCLGVACVISVIEGITPNIFSISKHLDIPCYDTHLQHAFERLRINGIFSNKFGVKHDPALSGNAKGHQWQTGTEVERNAWCMIAGISSGDMGMREIEKVEKDLKSESVGDNMLSLETV